MQLIYSLIAIVLLLWIAWIFNSFIRLLNMVRAATSDIEVQLKRRADLIPNLVEVVKSYAKHEKSLLEKITKLRSQILSQKSLPDKLDSNQALTTNVKSLLAIVEDYPELKANQNFLDLQKELAQTENQIEYARRFYNGAVRDYNTKIQTLPYNILASIFHFKDQPFFDYSGEDSLNVKI